MRWWVAAGVAFALVIAGLQGVGAQAASAAPAHAAAVTHLTKVKPPTAVPASVRAEDARPQTTSGAQANALAAARTSGRRTEVTADRTDFSQTFANPNGSLTYDASWSPIWVKRGSSWVRPDASLVRSINGSWSPAAATSGLSLSGGGGTTLATVTSDGRSLSVSWPSALPAPSVSGATATYANVFPGVDLAVTATTAGGFDETLIIENQAAAADPQLASLRLGVAASSGLTRTTAADGSAQWSAGSQSVFSSSAPVAWDSAPAGPATVGSTSAAPAAAGSALDKPALAGPGAGAQVAAAPADYSGNTVRLTIPRALLSGPASSFPVYVDPSYSATSTVLAHGEAQSDSPGSFWWNTSNMGVGDTTAAGIERSYYRMSIPGQLDGATVTAATFSDPLVSAETSASTSHTIDQYWTSGISTATTWSNQPSRNGSPAAATFTTTSTAPTATVNWNVATWIQDTINSGADNWTTGLVNTNETNVADWVGFSLSPTISVTYTAPVPIGTGPVPNGTLLSFPISDKSTLQVNVGSGNALFASSDITLPEESGPLTLGTDYNSLLVGTSVGTGSGGIGWRQREGQDVRLYPNLGTSGSVTFAGPDGVEGTFAEPAYGAPTYDSPPEFHATLTSTVTSTCSGSAYQMTWHDTGEVMCFNSTGLLTSQADRNGNTTAFTYNGSGQETQVAYTPKGGSSPTETVTVAWDSGCITSMTESGGSTGTKTVGYGYNATQLTQIQQPDGTDIDLGYDSSGNLNSIRNDNGAFTYVNYNSAHQVTSVVQGYNSNWASATTRLSYVSPTQTQVASPTTNQSEPVSSGPPTTYTINSEDLVTKAVDPQGNTRSTSYTPFNDVLTSSNGLASGTTSNTYGANNGESLTASQSPTGAATSLAYEGSSTTNPTAQYQLKSSTDAQGNSTGYNYDGAGNELNSTSGLAAEAQVSYNADGTPATSTDPDPSSGVNGGQTSYGYNSLHQLTSVTPSTSGSLKPVAITYDGFGRVSTVKNGDGDTVTYTYDLADRVLKAAYTGSGPAVTVTYAYDGAGNLETQTDPSGTTSYTYDGRDMVLTKTASSGGGTLTYTYDADGNMLTALDSGGTTTYTYNNLDQLQSLTDEAGDLWEFHYNAAGERDTTWFDTNTSESTWAAKTALTFDSSGRIAEINTTRDSASPTTVSDVLYCYTKYVSGATSCPAPTTATDTSLLQYSYNKQTKVASVDTYDKGNRLTGVTNDNGTTYAYGYNGDGDVTSGANRGNENYNLSNQLTNSGYAYDGAGQMTSTPSNSSLTYNDAGQWTGEGSESFTYAGASQDQVLSDGSATGITYGLAAQDGQPWIASYTPSGDSTDYVIRDQQGDPLGYVQNGTGYAFATDNLGSVTSVIDSCGCSVASYTYDPYGHVTSATGSDATQNLIEYTGALQDNDSNYTHLGDRWYNPITDNFTSQDTNSYLDNPANGNRYAYGAGDPANNIDPTGACSFFGCINSALNSFNNALFGGTCQANVTEVGVLIGVGVLAFPEISLGVAVGAAVGFGLGGGIAAKNLC